jgi:hypothetical protein
MSNQRRRLLAPNSTLFATMTSDASVKEPNGVGPDRKFASKRATLEPPNSMWQVASPRFVRASPSAMAPTRGTGAFVTSPMA